MFASDAETIQLWYGIALSLILIPIFLLKVLARHESEDTTPRSRHRQRVNARRIYPEHIPPREDLAYLFDDEGEAMRYLMDYNILNTMKCPHCGTEDPEPKWKSPWPHDAKVLPHRACLTLRCGKDPSHCWSPFRGTFFSKCRKPANKILELIYCWACRLSITQTSKLLRIYRGTVSQYFKYFREVCMAEVILLSQYIQLGGPGCLVEMDESKYGKRKYHRGRRVEGNWVWGAIERQYNPELGRYEAGECVMVVVPNRTAETLTKLIQRFIKPGSLIISDMWKAYQKIGDWKSTEVTPLSDEMYADLFGSYDEDEDVEAQNPLRDKLYLHQMVNHSQNFKDPITGAHTNTIEGHWRVSKDRIPKRAYADSCVLTEYLMEQIWDAKRKNVGRFFGMIDALRYVIYDEKERDLILKDRKGQPPVSWCAE